MVVLAVGNLLGSNLRVSSDDADLKAKEVGQEVLDWVPSSV